MSTYGADTEANSLMTSVTADETFEIPTIDLSGAQFQLPGNENNPLYTQIVPMTAAAVTTGNGGTGVFDVMMTTYKAMLDEQFKNNRITGSEYTKAFIALTQGAMEQAVQFALGKDQAYWQGQTAQISAITAMVGLQTAKVQVAATQLEAANTKANYALTKIRMAGESVSYATAVFNLNSTLPAQKSLLDQQLQQSVQQTALIVDQQAQVSAQTKLVIEQVETQRASTMNNRTDGSSIVGTLGAQRDLYAQQITSYQRNSETTAAKLFTDAWITQKTMDDGLTAPNGFTNSSIDTILTTLMTNNNLG